MKREWIVFYVMEPAKLKRAGPFPSKLQAERFELEMRKFEGYTPAAVILSQGVEG